LSCRHCYQNAHPQPDSDELTTEEKLNLIDQMGEEFVPFVAFAGGEPLVAPDLWKVLDHCRVRGIHVTLATNGTLLTPEMCARLALQGENSAGRAEFSRPRDVEWPERDSRQPGGI